MFEVFYIRADGRFATQLRESEEEARTLMAALEAEGLEVISMKPVPSAPGSTEPPGPRSRPSGLAERLNWGSVEMGSSRPIVVV